MSAFLQIEGIQGEASDKNYKGWLDITSYKWGTQRKITSHTGTQGNRESSNTRITDLTITRFMDKAAPKLFIEACCGRGKTITLAHTKTGSGNGNDPFVEFTLENAILSGYRVAAINWSATRPKEILTLSFIHLQIKYTPYDQDGNALPPIAVGFDTASNRIL